MTRSTLRSVIAIVALLLAILSVAGRGSVTTPLSIRVSGNHFVDGSGGTIRLFGSAHPGMQYECPNGQFSYGPWDQASVDAMAAWDFNTVRFPLNEDCWLGINGLPAAPMTAAIYRADVHTYVAEIEHASMYPILDNREAGPGTHQPVEGAEMADADHAPAFLASLAQSFKSDPAVIFDLYNEPNSVSMSCVRNGCTVTDTANGLGTYKAAGEQQLLNAIRATGAAQVVLESAPVYASDFRLWLSYALTDPLHQLGASAHPYQSAYWLHTATEWNTYLGPILAKYPVVLTEFGGNNCTSVTYPASVWTWGDAHAVSYLAYGWELYGCAGSTLSLITSWTGTPTQPYGSAYQSHLQIENPS